ncbi:MAG: ferritin [Bacteroidales bacterium]
MKKIIEDALNEQVKREEHSSRLYLQMATWCEVNGYPGAAAFLYKQADEERMHQLKFVHYINDRDGEALLQTVEAPESKYGSLKDLFEKVLAHEKYITASINDIYGLCLKENDFTTANFLQWFINEQIEEESTMRSILDKIDLAGDQRGGLFHIDKELSGMAAARASADAGGTTAE